MNEVLMIPDCNGRNNNSSMDLAVLMSMLNNGGGFGGGNWMWIIFLFFLEPLMRGGFFGRGNGGFGGNGYTDNLIDNTAGRELLSQAIQGNREAISNLANMFSTSTDFIKQAICGVDKAIAQLSGQVGMTGERTINALQQGNQQLASQLAQCCCDIRESVTAGNYQNQLAAKDNQLAMKDQTYTLGNSIDGVKSTVVQGFCDTAYAFRDQTCQLGQAINNSTQATKDAITNQTASIIAKLDAMELSALNNKIEAQRETISNLRTEANLKDQNLLMQKAVADAVGPVYAQLQAIKSSQPNTVTVPYYPFQVTPNPAVNPYGNGCGCGNGCQNQFWY